MDVLSCGVGLCVRQARALTLCPMSMEWMCSLHNSSAGGIGCQEWVMYCTYMGWVCLFGVCIIISRVSVICTHIIMFT